MSVGGRRQGTQEFIGVTSFLNAGKREGESPRHGDMEDAASCLSLVPATAFCPIARPFLFKGGDCTEN